LPSLEAAHHYGLVAVAAAAARYYISIALLFNVANVVLRVFLPTRALLAVLLLCARLA
jgi:hypothetical protein